MSNQSTITVILANRPRLFRELLHHALKTESPQIRVIESADGMPSSTLLKDADWMIVDEESANAMIKVAATNPKLGILSLDGRGSRVQLLAPATKGGWQSVSDIPTLSQLFDLLSQPAMQIAH